MSIVTPTSTSAIANRESARKTQVSEESNKSDETIGLDRKVQERSSDSFHDDKRLQEKSRELHKSLVEQQKKASEKLHDDDNAANKSSLTNNAVSLDT